MTTVIFVASVVSLVAFVLVSDEALRFWTGALAATEAAFVFVVFFFFALLPALSAGAVGSATKARLVGAGAVVVVSTTEVGSWFGLSVLSDDGAGGALVVVAGVGVGGFGVGRARGVGAASLFSVFSSLGSATGLVVVDGDLDLVGPRRVFLFFDGEIHWLVARESSLSHPGTRRG